jgi:hypothetical protein
MEYASYIASHRWRNNAARVREFTTAQGKCRLCAGEGPLEVHHRDCHREDDNGKKVPLIDGRQWKEGQSAAEGHNHAHR